MRSTAARILPGCGRHAVHLVVTASNDASFARTVRTVLEKHAAQWRLLWEFVLTFRALMNAGDVNLLPHDTAFDRAASNGATSSNSNSSSSSSSSSNSNNDNVSGGSGGSSGSTASGASLVQSPSTANLSSNSSAASAASPASSNSSAAPAASPASSKSTGALPTSAAADVQNMQRDRAGAHDAAASSSAGDVKIASLDGDNGDGDDDDDDDDDDNDSALPLDLLCTVNAVLMRLYEMHPASNHGKLTTLSPHRKPQLASFLVDTDLLYFLLRSSSPDLLVNVDGSAITNLDDFAQQQPSFFRRFFRLPRTKDKRLEFRYSMFTDTVGVHFLYRRLKEKQKRQQHGGSDNIRGGGSSSSSSNSHSNSNGSSSSSSPSVTDSGSGSGSGSGGGPGPGRRRRRRKQRPPPSWDDLRAQSRGVWNEWNVFASSMHGLIVLGCDPGVVYPCVFTEPVSGRSFSVSRSLWQRRLGTFRRRKQRERWLAHELKVNVAFKEAEQISREHTLRCCRLADLQAAWALVGQPQVQAALRSFWGAARVRKHRFQRQSAEKRLVSWIFREAEFCAFGDRPHGSGDVSKHRLRNIRRQRRDRGLHLVFAWGRANFQRVRSKQIAGPRRRLANMMAQRAPLVLVHEHRSSQLCCCLSSLPLKAAAHLARLDRLRASLQPHHDASRSSARRCPLCRRTRHRDRNGAANIANFLRCTLTRAGVRVPIGGSDLLCVFRPLAFTRSVQIPKASLFPPKRQPAAGVVAR